MGDWKLLGSVLEEVYTHSPIVGKIWLAVLFVFRMLVLGVAAEDVWDDEQRAFVCNTEQPGCRNVCFDEAFPISLMRYWVLQVIFVSSPSLVFMGHALCQLGALEKERKKRKAQLMEELGEQHGVLQEYKRELRRLEECRRVGKAPLRGALLRTYVVHILMRSVVEVGFMVGQYILYGVGLQPVYKCNRMPCPNTVDCFVSRPTEKTIFMVFMMAIAGVSLFLNLMEISHLGVKTIKQSLWGKGDVDCPNTSPSATNWEDLWALARAASLACEKEPLIGELPRHLPQVQTNHHPVNKPSAAAWHADAHDNATTQQNPKQPCQPSHNIDHCVLNVTGAEQCLTKLKSCDHPCRSSASHDNEEWHGGAYPMATVQASRAELDALGVLSKQTRPGCSTGAAESQGEPCRHLRHPSVGKERTQRSNSVPLSISCRSESKAPSQRDCPFMTPNKLNLPWAKRQAASDLVI